MSILLFIVILVVLILAHEFGHFIVAKKAGIRVDEFGLGFPPKLFGRKRGETEYSVNLLPFGGFVRIFGENPTEEALSGPDASRSFLHQPRWIQAAVIAAGVVFNIILAWILLSAGYMFGLPASSETAPAGATLVDTELTVVYVSPDSPAERAGFELGDFIQKISAGPDQIIDPSRKEMQAFMDAHGGGEVAVSFVRGESEGVRTVVPVEGVVGERAAVGLGLSEVGRAILPPHQALWEGARLTGELTRAIFFALGDFFAALFVGEANLDEIAGPVGIVGIVGDTSELGFVHVITLTALISINLAIINMIPFPALDGGRLLFLAIEAVKGSAINPRVAGAVNMIGFALLIILLLVITYNDIANLITG